VVFGNLADGGDERAEDFVCAPDSARNFWLVYSALQAERPNRRAFAQDAWAGLVALGIPLAHPNALWVVEMPVGTAHVFGEKLSARHAAQTPSSHSPAPPDARPVSGAAR